MRKIFSMSLYKKFAIVSDFDGTITKIDAGDFLLVHFKLMKEREIELGYELNIPVEKWMKEYFSRIGAIKPSLIRKAIKEHIKPRPFFMDTAKYCLEKGIPFEVVSGGVDIYSKPFFNREKIKLKSFFGKCVISNGKARISYPYLKGISLSEFKKERVKYYKNKGHTVIFCGDAPNDLLAAKSADIVFAARMLPELLKKEKIKFFNLDSFQQVLKILKNSEKQQ